MNYDTKPAAREVVDLSKRLAHEGRTSRACVWTAGILAYARDA
jgi:hypothetical protein